MGNQSDFDLRREAKDEPRTASVSRIRERTRPTPAYAHDDDRDPVLDWDTHHAGSLQLPATHRPQLLVRANLDAAPPQHSPAANGTALRSRADVFSLEVAADLDDDADVPDGEPQNEIGGETEHPRAATAPIATLRRQLPPQPSRSPLGRAVAVAVAVALVVAGTLIVLSGHAPHHTANASASLGTRSRLLTNPLTTTPTRSAKPTSLRHQTNPAAADRPRHHVNRKPQHVRHHKTASSEAKTVTHTASSAEQASTTPTYTAPAPTTPTSTSTSPSGGSSSPSTTSSSGSSSSSGTHPSSAAKQPALGATGTLAPGSSPDG